MVPQFAIIAAILTGALLGLIQSLVIVYARVPSFIATLAGLLAWQGVQLIVLGSRGERLISDPVIRGIASAYLSPAVGYAIGVLVVLAAGALMWRRQRQRVRAGLPGQPARLVAMKLGGLALALGLVITGLNTYFGVPVILLLLGGLVLARSTACRPPICCQRQRRRCPLTVVRTMDALLAAMRGARHGHEAATSRSIAELNPSKARRRGQCFLP